MSTPTQQVTRNAQDMLDHHEVILALRVEWGAEAREHARSTQLVWSRPPWSVLFLPLLELYRLPIRAKRMRAEPNVWGILALTSIGGRILLASTPWRRKRPIGVVEVLPHNAPLQLDLELMETDLIPLLRVGHREFVVNGVDFKALVKAVEGGVVRSFDIEHGLDRLKATSQKLYG